MAPAVVNRLPIISNLLKWFKGDDLIIDNALFKLHHQVHSQTRVKVNQNLPVLSQYNDAKLFSSVLLTISTFQASTFIIMFGLLFIFLENHLDGRAIVCQGGDQYARYEKQTNSTRK